MVGVTGSIAAYKAAELVSALRQREADVRVIMTAHAQELVGPATFRALSGHDVATAMFDGAEQEIEHVSLARFAEALAIVPATANVLGKMAAGIADDLLTTNVLAVECPIVVAPAMNWRMWENPAVQENVAKLRERGVIIVDPERGFLACGEEGGGRMASLPRLLAAIRYALRVADLAGSPSPLSGKKVIVTAGPTREHIDPIRFISNPSSGAMGFEIARELRARGAEVTVVHGPTHLSPPAECEAVDVTTADEMAEAVLDRIDDADVFIGAAAVADFRPETEAPEKIHKTDAGLTLKLVRTPDIIHEVRNRRDDILVVGFAAETTDAVIRALAKLRDKGMDMIVANEVGPDRGFGEGETSVTIVRPDGHAEPTPVLPKDEIASLIVDAVEELVEAREAGG